MKTVIDFLSGTRFFNPFLYREEARHFHRILGMNILSLLILFMITFFLSRMIYDFNQLILEIINELYSIVKPIILVIYETATETNLVGSSREDMFFVFFYLFAPLIAILIGLFASIPYVITIKYCAKMKLFPDIALIPIHHDIFLKSCNIFIWLFIATFFLFELLFYMGGFVYSIFLHTKNYSAYELSVSFLLYMNYQIALKFILWRFIVSFITDLLLGINIFRFIVSYAARFTLLILASSIVIYLFHYPEGPRDFINEDFLTYTIGSTILLFLIIYVFWLLTKENVRLKELILGRHESLLYVREYWLINEEIEPTASQIAKNRQKLKEFYS